jgi:spore coat polysaccharide biosynthesis protein SpsF
VKTVAIIQARVGSSRLRGKVLLPLAGEPMLARVIERASRARLVDEVVVATTTSQSDDAIEALCRQLSVPCIRGSEADVLSRYCAAAAAHSADAIVRITSDCPLIDPTLVDLVVTALTTPDQADYAANIVGRRTFPRGLDAEAMTSATLDRLDRDAVESSLREHVTLYIHRNPALFRTRAVTGDVDRSGLRWTVDTQDDYELVSRIYDAFGSDRFSTDEILAVLTEHPEWMQLNAHVEQKAV